MTDASPLGGALVATEASPAELRSECRYGDRAGWVVITETDQFLRRKLDAAADSSDSEEEQVSESPERELVIRVLILGLGD